MATGSNPKRRSKIPSQSENQNDPVLQVRLISADANAFKKFVETTPVEFACAGPRVSPKGVVTAHVLMRESVAKRAAAQDVVKVEIVADLTATTGKRRAEVGRGNRFENPQVLPIGRGVLLRKPS
jgi:hypothetical protein